MQPRRNSDISLFILNTKYSHIIKIFLYNLSIIYFTEIPLEIIVNNNNGEINSSDYI